MLKLFLALPGLVQAIIGGALIAALIGGYLAWRTSIYQDGYRAAINGIAAQDQEAINARNEALARRRACTDAGGVWRPATGQCEGR